MGLTKDKLEFVYDMSHHTGMPLGPMLRLMRYGASYKRLMEDACNREFTASDTRKVERIQKRVREELETWSCDVKFSGDPRGATMKIKVPDGHTNDWGQEGICVPTS